MTAFLKFLLILDAFVVVAAILLQSGKGGGVAASFGGASSSAAAFTGGRPRPHPADEAELVGRRDLPRPLVHPADRLDALARADLGARPDVHAARRRHR